MLEGWALGDFGGAAMEEPETNVKAKAAEASILGARAAERNAKYMFASVMVAAFSALVALASAIASASRRTTCIGVQCIRGSEF
jgi:hypothetical protein